MMLVRRQGWIFMLLVAVVSLVALTSSVIPFGEIRDQQLEIEAARSQLADLKQRGGELMSRIGALQTPVEIERIARERLGYVMPGETAFVVMDPEPAPGVADQTVVGGESFSESHPWYRRVWAFLTGADL
jgi:cell division protein FtsB